MICTESEVSNSDGFQSVVGMISLLVILYFVTFFLLKFYFHLKRPVKVENPYIPRAVINDKAAYGDKDRVRITEAPSSTVRKEGWYPTEAGLERYWNGTTWTDEYRDYVAPETPENIENFGEERLTPEQIAAIMKEDEEREAAERAAYYDSLGVTDPKHSDVVEPSPITPERNRNGALERWEGEGGELAHPHDTTPESNDKE